MKYLSKIKNVNVILASASPQRATILNQLRIAHRVLPTHMREHSVESLPHGIVCDLAEQKAKCGLQLYAKTADTTGVKEQARPTLVIGADTVVWNNGECYGKPQSKSHAREMLRSLSGKRHEVYSGVCVMVLTSDDVDTSKPQIYTDFDSSTVSFACLRADEIEAYLETDQWCGVAGGYAIQGISACFVERIEGSYSTIMGLPIKVLYDIMKFIL